MLVVSLSSQAFSVDSTAASVKKSVVETVDSTKKAIVETANAVDTSRLSKQVYGDVKQALVGIASALKVGVEHVYKVLVVQQIVKSITWFILLLIPTILFVIFKKRCYDWCKENSDDSDGISWLVYAGIWIAWLVSSGVGIGHLDTIVTGFVNPEYGALQDILNFIQTVKK